MHLVRIQKALKYEIIVRGIKEKKRMIVVYGLNMRSLYSVLDEFCNLANRGRAKNQQIIIEQDKAINHILQTPQIGKMFLVQGERPKKQRYSALCISDTHIYNLCKFAFLQHMFSVR